MHENGHIAITRRSITQLIEAAVVLAKNVTNREYRNMWIGRKHYKANADRKFYATACSLLFGTLRGFSLQAQKQLYRCSRFN